MTVTERVISMAGLRRVSAMALLLVSLVLGSVLFSGQVFAQEGIAWSGLSEEERSLLRQLEDEWAGFPPERQERLRRGVMRWQQMAPEERIEAQRQQNLFQQMPLEQRELINRRFQQFNSVPQGQQQRLREIQRQFRSLPPAQRDALRQRFENQRLQREQMRPEGLQNRPIPPGVRPGGREIPKVVPPRIERPAPERVTPPVRPAPSRG